jgi:hypothetical protein
MMINCSRRRKTTDVHSIFGRCPAPFAPFLTA